MQPSLFQLEMHFWLNIASWNHLVEILINIMFSGSGNGHHNRAVDFHHREHCHRKSVLWVSRLYTLNTNLSHVRLIWAHMTDFLPFFGYMGIRFAREVCWLPHNGGHLMLSTIRLGGCLLHSQDFFTIWPWITFILFQLRSLIELLGVIYRQFEFLHSVNSLIV